MFNTLTLADESLAKVVSILKDCKIKRFWGDIELKIQDGQVESIKISQVVKSKQVYVVVCEKNP